MLTDSAASKHSGRLWLLGILLVGALLRLMVVANNPMPVGDGVASHMEMARHLMQGEGFSTMRKWTLYDQSMLAPRPEANRQPALSLMLVGVFTLTGRIAFLDAQLLMVIWGLLLLKLFSVYARRLLGSTAALLATAYLAISPLFVWYSTQVDSLIPYTCMVLLAVIVADREKLRWRQVVALALISALAYITRTQGMLLALSVLAYVLMRGEGAVRQRLLKAVIFTAIFLILCAPWFLRNVSQFGSPTHSQNAQFLLNQNHWSAWEVRDAAPSPLDLFRYGGLPSVATHLAAGALRVIEPFTTGTLHRGAIFAAPSLLVFLVLGIVLIVDSPRLRKRLLLPLLVSVPVMLFLVLHDHPHRYLSFQMALVVALGMGGLLANRALFRDRGRLIRCVLVVLLFLPLARPVAGYIARNTGQESSEAVEIARWLTREAGSDDWVVTFPNVELFIWEYDLPTLTMPNDYECLLWPCLERHDVRYVIVDPDLPLLRPHLSSRWVWAPDGSGWQTVDPPPFLREVHRSSTGRTIVYEWQGTVPEDFMRVDCLPPDNMRALPPRSRDI